MTTLSPRSAGAPMDNTSRLVPSECSRFVTRRDGPTPSAKHKTGRLKSWSGQLMELSAQELAETVTSFLERLLTSKSPIITGKPTSTHRTESKSLIFSQKTWSSRNTLISRTGSSTCLSDMVTSWPQLPPSATFTTFPTGILPTSLTSRTPLPLSFRARNSSASSKALMAS